VGWRLRCERRFVAAANAAAVATAAAASSLKRQCVVHPVSSHRGLLPIQLVIGEVSLIVIAVGAWFARPATKLVVKVVFVKPNLVDLFRTILPIVVVHV
jgi:hypothetical protein